jgi:AraC family transcriptional regulator, regulatory protein of adaptative response / DNA-3-methyladenine glycosylase II
MNLNWQARRRARLARDVRFDGKFFVGILSTRIYCRPSCPVPTVKDKNIRYFPSAPAAAEAGFRPCLRCRPECSPGTPAWLGTPSTVSRALRLIAESGMEDGGVEALAERLGVGSRHLRRLFVKHLGATPSAVAQTRRLHFAKKLIDETTLPMNQIAVSAGFGCVRRFNATIFKTYHRTPTQIRRLARPAEMETENEYLFRLRFRPPYDWEGMLAFLAARATPGVEVVENECYRRSICLNGSRGYFEVTLDESNPALVARVHFPDPLALFLIIEKIRQMFDLNADWVAIVETLKSDPALVGAVQANPGLRIPGCWSGFELAVRAILGQQITVKGATALAGQIVRAFGEPFSVAPVASGLSHLFPRPASLAEADFSSIGLPRTRAQSIRALAQGVSAGEICFEGLVHLDGFLEQLCKLPGIGKWTAQYIAMRALGEPDAFPSGDIGLLRALGLTSSSELEQRSEAWRPWRAYATMYLWCRAGDGRAGKSKPGAARPVSSKTERTSLTKAASQPVSIAV